MMLVNYSTLSCRVVDYHSFSCVIFCGKTYAFAKDHSSFILCSGYSHNIVELKVLKRQYFSVPQDCFGMGKVDRLGFGNPIQIKL